MKRTVDQIEQAQEIARDFLNQTDNNPHAAYDQYIKFYLTSGKSLPAFVEGIKDFIKCSKPEVKAIKKQTPTKQKETICMTIEEVLTNCKNLFNIYHTEQLEAARQGNKEKEFENWKQSQPYEILIFKITGKEYVCNLPR